MAAVLSALQECAFEMKFLIATAYCTLLCTIKWSLRAGLNWNEGKVENILPRANMHPAHGTRLQLVWHHTSNSPSYPECGCHFLSIDFVSVLVLLFFPTCSFRLACDTDQFLYILRQTAMEKSMSQVWEKWKVLFYITSYVVCKLPLVPSVLLTESKPHIRFILQTGALKEKFHFRLSSAWGFLTLEIWGVGDDTFVSPLSESESHATPAVLVHNRTGNCLLCPMWNFVYMIEWKGKCFNIFLPSTLNLT